MNDYYETTISNIVTENYLIKSFILKPVPKYFKSRTAGQHLLIKQKINEEWSESHPFTITSKRNSDYLRISVKKLGAFTSQLHNAKIGEKVLISGPFGKFGEGIEEKNNIFIAGGIGITPFISFLEHLNDINSKKTITLLWANENEEDLFNIERLKELLKVLNLKIVFIINNLKKEETSGKMSWKKGYLSADFIKEFIDGNDKSIYMCGSPNMQKYIFSQLDILKVSTKMIKTEKFGIYMKS